MLFSRKGSEPENAQKGTHRNPGGGAPLPSGLANELKHAAKDRSDRIGGTQEEEIAEETKLKKPALKKKVITPPASDLTRAASFNIVLEIVCGTSKKVLKATSDTTIEQLLKMVNDPANGDSIYLPFSGIFLEKNRSLASYWIRNGNSLELKFFPESGLNSVTVTLLDGSAKVIQYNPLFTTVYGLKQQIGGFSSATLFDVVAGSSLVLEDTRSLSSYSDLSGLVVMKKVGRASSADNLPGSVLGVTNLPPPPAPLSSSGEGSNTIKRAPVIARVAKSEKRRSLRFARTTEETPANESESVVTTNNPVFKSSKPPLHMHKRVKSNPASLEEMKELFPPPSDPSLDEEEEKKDKDKEKKKSKKIPSMINLNVLIEDSSLTKQLQFDPEAKVDEILPNILQEFGLKDELYFIYSTTQKDYLPAKKEIGSLVSDGALLILRKKEAPSAVGLRKKKKPAADKRLSMAVTSTVSTITQKKEIFSHMNRFLKSRPSPEDLVEQDILKPEEVDSSVETKQIVLPLKLEVIQRLVRALVINDAHKVVGIFRVAGAARRKLEIYENLENESYDLNQQMPHDLANALKYYCREAPVSVIPTNMYDRFIKLYVNSQINLEQLNAAIMELPPLNRAVLSWLAGFLTLVTENSEQNKMTAENIGIVFGPTLLRTNDMQADFQNSTAYAELVASLISGYKDVFPESEQIDCHQIDLELQPQREELQAWRVAMEKERKQQLPPSASVTEPVAQSSFKAGDSVPIAWITTGKIEKVNVRLLQYGAEGEHTANLLTDIAKDIDAEQDHYKWTVPAGEYVGLTLFFLVQSSDHPHIFGNSFVFTIYEPEATPAPPSSLRPSVQEVEHIDILKPSEEAVVPDAGSISSGNSVSTPSKNAPAGLPANVALAAIPPPIKMELQVAEESKRTPKSPRKLVKKKRNQEEEKETAEKDDKKSQKKDKKEKEKQEKKKEKPPPSITTEEQTGPVKLVSTSTSAAAITQNIIADLKNGNIETQVKAAKSLAERLQDPTYRKFLSVTRNTEELLDIMLYLSTALSNEQ